MYAKQLEKISGGRLEQMFSAASFNTLRMVVSLRTSLTNFTVLIQSVHGFSLLL